jgi:capsular polysaccharide export protein
MRATIFSIGRFFDDQSHVLCRELRDARCITWGAEQRFRYRDYKRGQAATSWQEAGYPISEILRGDVLAIWNGTMPHLVPIVKQARAKNMKLCYIENGFFGGTQQWDPQGINAGSTAATVPAEVFAGRPADPLIWREAFQQRKVEYTAGQPPEPGDTNPLPARFAFFPMQIEQDTQIQQYSPVFRSVENALQSVYEALPDGLPLVVKEHPSARTRDGSTARMQRYPKAIFCRHRTIDELLLQASCVVTVNSSVGLQALVRRVPLVTLGQTVYGRAEWCQCVAVREDLPTALQCFHEYPVDVPRLGAFLTWLKNSWSIPWQFPAMVRRIQDIADGRAPWLEELS